MVLIKPITLFISILLFTSCSVGLHELDDHTYITSYNARQAEIRVTGQPHDGPHRVKQLVLVAASRYTLEHDFTHFAVLSRNADQSFTDVQLTNPSVSVREDGYGALRAEYDEGASITLQRSTNELNIIMLTEEEYRRARNEMSDVLYVDANHIKTTYDQSIQDQRVEESEKIDPTAGIFILIGSAIVTIISVTI